MHVLDREAPLPDRVEAYAPGPTGAVDLYAAVGASRGGVILLHGGFWRAAYDRTHLRPLAVGLAGAGYDVALPEYRRVGDTGGGIPGTVDDVGEILRCVPRMLGCARSDVNIVGHSAGGHLAMLAAAAVLEPPARVVSLAGVLDISAANDAKLSNHAVADLLGDRTPSDALLATIDTMTLPLPRCDIFLVHGENDGDVPVEYSRSYAGRSTSIALDVVSNSDHYNVIDPESDAFASLLYALRPRRPEN